MGVILCAWIDIMAYNYKNSNVKMENSSSELNKLLSNPSHSKYSKSQASSHPDFNDPKKRYAAVIQQEKQQERTQLHKRLQKQKEEEERAHKKHLKAEINKRKKQLEHLEREKESGIEQHKKAAYLAQLKKEKDAIKRLQQSTRAKTADQKSKLRYKAAKERQKEIDRQVNKKRIQADNLRKTHMEIQAVERVEATKFNQSLVERRAKEEQRKIKIETKVAEQYRKGLSLHGFSQKLLDKSKPITLIFKENQEDGEAMTKGQKQQIRNSQRDKLREQAQLKNRKIAEDRGNQVLSKMQRQKQYEAYCKEAQQQQRRYNLRRLQAGKKNQFAGVKPMTLSQIDINKKLRSQKQFEKMFIKAITKNDNIQHANKYKVSENKMRDVIVESKTAEKWVKKPIIYADHQSLIPGISQGHYSFEQEQEHNIQTQSKSEKEEKQPIKPIIKETVKQNEVHHDFTGKNRLKETRISNQAPKQQLAYSDSEEDSNI